MNIITIDVVVDCFFCTLSVVRLSRPVQEVVSRPDSVVHLRDEFIQAVVSMIAMRTLQDQC